VSLPRPPLTTERRLGPGKVLRAGSTVPYYVTVRPRRHPAGPARGFWEVTTCAIADWPCQARLVELIDAGGYLSIVCTMADHDTPPAPASLATGDGLAALHRELAANAPLADAGSGLAGEPGDRNVELRIRPPFPLRRLTGE